MRIQLGLYYKNAQVAIIVYDVTNEQSFDSVKAWIDELEQ